MSIKSRLLLAAATLTLIGSVPAVVALSASAATPACGERCVSIFTPEFGTRADPQFVEAVLDGEAKVGQPLILRRASSSDSSEDLIPALRRVTDFFADGMVSAEVDRHYGELFAAQIQYAPFGVISGLCVGIARPALSNQALTLQPCSVPGTTVWIAASVHSPETAPDEYFPLVNASTRNFTRPIAMDYPHNAHPTDEPATPIRVRHLKTNGPGPVPALQLWGLRPGVLD